MDTELWATAKDGPVKYPVVRTKTDRVDVEVIRPSEALDLENECGSGLCQQLAGDFLFHCHVAHHYVAGMWGYGRTYNTLQVGQSHTDTMPDLRELPDPEVVREPETTGKRRDTRAPRAVRHASSKSHPPLPPASNVLDR